MAIPEPIRKNFDTLLDAARRGHLAVMECTRRTTGEPSYVLCAVNRPENDFEFVPFGELCAQDPYVLYEPPTNEESDEQP